MPSLRYVVKLSSVTLLILGFVFAAEAQNGNLGFSGPQNLADYLRWRLSEANARGQPAALDPRALKKRADRGDAPAALILGEDYYIGANGVPQDLTRAAAYFRESADRGNADAEFYFGIMNLQGQGMPQDSAKAAAWYRKAADQGDADAQYSLGSLYAEGQGVPQDDTRAAEWYRKAAARGLAFAQYDLGLFYDVGRGVPKDDTQAAMWYGKAAAQGFASAQYNLGLLYTDGNGVPRDYARAAAWYRKAAEQGNAAAQYNLGVAYSTGRGVKQEDAEAYFWIYLAAQGRLEGTEQRDIDQARDVTASYLTAAELSQIQERARKWLKAHPM